MKINLKGLDDRGDFRFLTSEDTWMVVTSVMGKLVKYWGTTKHHLGPQEAGSPAGKVDMQ